MTVTADTTTGTTSTLNWRNSPTQKRADRYLLLGASMCGTIVLGPIGLPIVVYGFYLNRKARQAGETVRPKTLLIVAFMVLLDGALNYFAWGMDLFPSHDTTLGLTWLSGLGRILDGAYYVGHDTTSLGGTSFPAEKAQQLACIFILFPIRIAAGWAMLNMKRWGAQMVVVTSWCYIFIWVIYLSAQMLQWHERMGTSLFGWTGYMVLNVFGFLDAFITLPYLYSLDTRKWR